MFENTKSRIRNLMKSEANIINLHYRNALNDFKNDVTSKFLKCIHDDNKRYIYLLHEQIHD